MLKRFSIPLNRVAALPVASAVRLRLTGRDILKISFEAAPPFRLGGGTASNPLWDISVRRSLTALESGGAAIAFRPVRFCNIHNRASMCSTALTLLLVNASRVD